MRRSCVILAATLTWGLLAQPTHGRAQTAAPGAEDQATPGPILERVVTEVVLIEAYVTDKLGRPVKGLGIDDFILKVNGHKKPISSLEYIETVPAEKIAADKREVRTAEPSSDEAPTREASNDAAGTVPVRRFPRRFLLFFEDSTSSPGGMSAARTATQEFIESRLAPDDQIAIVSYDQYRKMQILIDFTSDREALKAALQENLDDRTRISDYASEFERRQEELWEILKTPVMKDNRGTDQSLDMRRIRDETARARGRSYAQMDNSLMARIVDSMRSLVDSLAAWPGYRALVFIGEGIPENPGADYGVLEDRFGLSNEIGILAHAAAASGVTLHSISTTGLAAGRTGVLARARNRSNSLRNLALTTGGMALTSNDMGESLATMEEGSRAYYLIGYEPEGPPDGLYYSVTVKMKARGTRVRYRGGFHRMLPEQARERAVQAAHVLPELHPDLGLELSAVPGPAGVAERVIDLVLYIPAIHMIFVPQEGKPTARIEVGLVALDRNGRETLRLAQRVRLGLSPDLDLSHGLGFNFFSRVHLPTISQTITAVVSDLQGSALGATRLALESSSPDAADLLGLSIYSLTEQSVWIEVDPDVAPEEDAEIEASYTMGPALRRIFAPGEAAVCGFRLPPARDGEPPELRLRIMRGEVNVLSHELQAESDAAPGMVRVMIPLEGLSAGEYRVLIQEIGPFGLVDRGSLPLTIRPAASGGVPVSLLQ